MITPNRIHNALFAMQGILIQARLLANEPQLNKEVGAILDYAEDLPRMLASPIDETDRFRVIITEISARFRCAFILERFDNPVPLALVAIGGVSVGVSSVPPRDTNACMAGRCWLQWHMTPAGGLARLLREQVSWIRPPTTTSRATA